MTMNLSMTPAQRSVSGGSLPRKDRDKDFPTRSSSVDDSGFPLQSEHSVETTKMRTSSRIHSQSHSQRDYCDTISASEDEDDEVDDDDDDDDEHHDDHDEDAHVSGSPKTKSRSSHSARNSQRRASCIEASVGSSSTRKRSTSTRRSIAHHDISSPRTVGSLEEIPVAESEWSSLFRDSPKSRSASTKLTSTSTSTTSNPEFKSLEEEVMSALLSSSRSKSRAKSRSKSRHETTPSEEAAAGSSAPSSAHSRSKSRVKSRSSEAAAEEDFFSVTPASQIRSKIRNKSTARSTRVEVDDDGLSIVSSAQRGSSARAKSTHKSRSESNNDDSRSGRKSASGRDKSRTRVRADLEDDGVSVVSSAHRGVSRLSARSKNSLEDDELVSVAHRSKSRAKSRTKDRESSSGRRSRSNIDLEDDDDDEESEQEEGETSNIGRSNAKSSAEPLSSRSKSRSKGRETATTSSSKRAPSRGRGRDEDSYLPSSPRKNSKDYDDERDAHVERSPRRSSKHSSDKVSSSSRSSKSRGRATMASSDSPTSVLTEGEYGEAKIDEPVDQAFLPPTSAKGSRRRSSSVPRAEKVHTSFRNPMEKHPTESNKCLQFVEPQPEPEQAGLFRSAVLDSFNEPISSSSLKSRHSHSGSFEDDAASVRSAMKHPRNYSLAKLASHQPAARSRDELSVNSSLSAQRKKREAKMSMMMKQQSLAGGSLSANSKSKPKWITSNGNTIDDSRHWVPEFEDDNGSLFSESNASVSARPAEAEDSTWMKSMPEEDEHIDDFDNSQAFGDGALDAFEAEPQKGASWSPEW